MGRMKNYLIFLEEKWMWSGTTSPRNSTISFLTYTHRISWNSTRTTHTSPLQRTQQMFEYDPLIDPLLPITMLDLLFDENGGLTAEAHELLYEMEQNGEFV
jgi:hypothetical protein